MFCNTFELTARISSKSAIKEYRSGKLVNFDMVDDTEEMRGTRI